MREEFVRRAIGVLAVVVGAFVVIAAFSVLSGVAGLGSGSTFQSVMQPLAVSIPAVAFTVRAYRNPVPGGKMFYGLAAAALWFSTLGTAIAMIAPASAFPSVSDYINMGVYAMASVGVLFMSSRRAVTHLLDGLVVASSLLFVSWSLVLSPVVDAFDGNLVATLVSLTSPACDFILLSALIVTARRGTSMLSRTTLVFLGCAVSVDAVGGTLWASEGLHQPQPPLTFVCWIITSFFYTVASWKPARKAAVKTHPVTLRYALMPYIPAGVGAIAGGVMFLCGTDMQPILFVPAGTAVIAIMTRQFFALVENVVMARELETSNSKLRIREEQLTEMAYNDPLTGLANRRSFEARVAQLAELGTAGFSVMLLDVDDFKHVNDTYGHEAGDALLVTVAEVLQSVVRTDDIVARLGGDEFAVVLPGAARDVAVQIAERISEIFRAPTSIGSRDIDVTLSVGVAESDPSASFSAILRQADVAMYRRKHVEGKGGVAVFAAAI